MKIIKKAFSIVLVLMLLFSLGVSANAAEKKEDKYVSAGQIKKEIETLYKKYNTQCDIIEFNQNVKYTGDEVDLELQKLEESLASYEYFIDAGEADAKESMINWVYTKTYTTYANISNGALGNATIELKCSGTIYDGTSTFTDISNISTRQYGSAFNFVSWNQYKSGYNYLENKKKADVWAEGTLVTEAYILGQKIRTTLNHGIGMIIQAG
ncbi:hypothetical protein [Clostridium grantii]|uniref:Uncharacterized protein n=1 Tax=Clostridium grantii DSM 8605 TaxID=1121316 RepID=A0A1M5Y4V6_9CLOT|nr:hypothetical protein [Clostridium grantii]SHI07091.1 hypothetical protein SAMN02745207_04199 [Clostridium grantii DSM 8605]